MRVISPVKAVARTAAALALLLLAGSCAGAPATAPGADEPPPGTAEPAAPAPPPTPEPEAATDGQEVAPGAGLTVAATVFPLAWMAREIAPEAELTTLGARGQDPHDLELTPGERALLDRGDVVVYMGDLGFQPDVEGAVAERGGVTVSVREVVGDGALLVFDDHDHDDDHGHDDHDEGDHDEGDHGPYDPHLWFDAAAMAGVATALAEAFATVDPDAAQHYLDRGDDLRARLDALDADLDGLLADCTFETAIVSHEAYAYLLEPRGLHQEGIASAGGHGEASPQRLVELTERIRAEGIPAVLAEPLEGRADAETLAREAGVPLIDIDPLEIVDDAAFETGYLSLLRQQGEAFAQALGCGGAGAAA